MNDLCFGKRYRDLITGKEGILTARVIFVTGCDRFRLTNNENKEDWFDEFSLEYVDDGIYEKVKDKINNANDVDEAIYDFEDYAQDIISEYKGKIIAKAIHISGDISYGLSPKYNYKAKENDAQWYDEGRVKLVSETKTSVTKESKRVGGVTPNLKIR